MSDSSSSDDRVLGESTAVDITGKIMVVMIIVLFMFVVFFLFFHLYAKRRTTNNNSRLLRSSYGVVGGGLDPSVLRSLPVSIFQYSPHSQQECSVCLSEFVEGEKMRLLPKCNHPFHLDCIDMWFHSHSTCPLCRTSLVQQQPNIDAEIISSNPESQQQPRSFPTNVLIWGNHNQTQITSTSTAATSHPPSSFGDNNNYGLVIDIPTSDASSSFSAEEDNNNDNEMMKSPLMMMRTLRTMRRLLSNNRLNPWTNSTSTSTDAEEQEQPKGPQQEPGHT